MEALNGNFEILAYNIPARLHAIDTILAEIEMKMLFRVSECPVLQFV